MLCAMICEISLQPALNGSVVKFDIVVHSGCKFIGIEYLNGSFLPPGSDGLPFSQINLNMNHFVRKRLQLRVVIRGTVKN